VYPVVALHLVLGVSAMDVWQGCPGFCWTDVAAIVDGDGHGTLGLDRLVMWTPLMPFGGCDGWFCPCLCMCRCDGLVGPEKKIKCHGCETLVPVKGWERAGWVDSL